MERSTASIIRDLFARYVERTAAFASVFRHGCHAASWRPAHRARNACFGSQRRL
jgi:hypothetical protein